MKVLILVAGRGTRISRYLSGKPKCTVDIGNKKLIQYTIELLPHVNPAFFEDLKKYPSVVSLIRRKRMEDFNHVVAYFNKGIEQGIFQPEVNMELFIRLLNITTNNCMEADIYKHYPIDEIYRAILFTYLRGIATKKGLQIIEEFILKAKETDQK